MAGVEKDVAPVVDWLDKWASPESKRKKRGGKTAGAAAVRRLLAMQKRKQRQHAKAVYRDIMGAMRQSTPEQPALLPGPGLLPFGELPKQLRDSMPRGRWLGLELDALGDKGLRYLQSLQGR